MRHTSTAGLDMPVTQPARAVVTVTRQARITALALISCLFLIVLGSALRAEFYVIEDHLLVVGRHWGLAAWLSRITADAEVFQRVRPGYWLYVALGDHLFGVNPHLWHAAALAWGVLATYLLSMSLRRIGADWVSVAVFVLVLLLGGSQNWVWVSLIPQETTGMLMTAVAVWAMVLASTSERAGPWDALAVVAMAVAGSIKESFIILIPALLLLRLVLEVHIKGSAWPQALRNSLVAIGCGTVIFVMELGVVLAVVRSQPGGYAASASGMSLASLAPSRLIRTLSTLDSAAALGVAAVVWLVLWFDGAVRRSLHVAAALILSLWVGPQFILYSNSFAGRYLLPAMAGIAAAAALAIAALLRRRQLRVIGGIGVLLMLPIFARCLTATTLGLTSFTAETIVTDRAIAFVSKNVPASQAVLIATDSGTPYGFESTHSVPQYATLAGSRSAFYLWPLLSRGERSALHIAASKNNTAFKYPDTMGPHDVGAILIMDKGMPSFDPQPLNAWLGRTNWRQFVFTEPYYTWAWSSGYPRQVGTVTQRVLISWSGSVPLLSIGPPLSQAVTAAPLLDTPIWGTEPESSGTGSLVWIGQGDAESVATVLSVDSALTVELVCNIQPGPSLPGGHRKVELAIENRAGSATMKRTFDGGEWRFRVPLEAGANRLRLRVMDSPTITVQPNGDSRRLMALLRQITVQPVQ
jgi:hypothetical protein